MRWSIDHGDCREILRDVADNSLDACVTDPPYELGFMGKKWDGSGVAFQVETWAEILRVLKPGGHLLAFGGTRTYHRMACAIEDAGFEVRDSLHWMYGTGFPKSLNIGEGRGTALKPGHEPIVMARKPPIGTVADNVEKWGTGALRIDDSRIEGTKWQRAPRINSYGLMHEDAPRSKPTEPDNASGRWPANVILDEDAAAELDDQSGNKTGAHGRSAKTYSHDANGWGNMHERASAIEASRGGASRFYYVAKASKRERNTGCAVPNDHPTIKPVELMRHLVRLVTPVNGIVLDPFCGSGTTGVACIQEGLRFAGIEQSAEYIEIARQRIQFAEGEEAA